MTVLGHKYPLHKNFNLHFSGYFKHSKTYIADFAKAVPCIPQRSQEARDFPWFHIHEI